MHSLASVEQGPLLELRTKAGALYLCPSRFERMRLRWAFRHFRVLPLQLLSRRDQQLIERLCQSAVVTPLRPVSSDAILGVVEKMHLPVLDDALPPSRWDPRWGGLGALAAAIILVAGMLVSGRISLHHLRTVPVAHAAMQEPSAPTRMMADAVPEPAVPLAPAPILGQPAVPGSHPVVAGAVTQRPAPSVSLPSVSVPEDSAAVKRWITALPSGRFARPVVGENSPVGEVELSALIAPDGSVQAVRALSGNPALAQAGIRAVRRWHYSPYGAPGAPAEEETQIRMNFFGPDAVSIAVQPR